ncbi:MAG: BrnA antitoxin family protein [Candidatus Sulfotelmatobacter sp.]
MKHKERVTKSSKSGRRSDKAATAGARRKSGQGKGLSLTASAEPSRRSPVSMREVMEFYKPIKKPITLRLDADVLAWFRRDGRRYQTRINGALRRVMEREMKEAGD